MRLLLSNDDGVFAEGLTLLHKRLAIEHDITVIAPDRNCSGASNALSLHSPLRIQQMQNGFYAINGTPTDCVHMGVNAFLEQEPELVVSGINHGPNMGDDVVYSGTVAAATEGRYMGLPALAVSLASHEGKYFDTAAKVVASVIERLPEHPLKQHQILNINVPDLPYDELKGIKVTRLGKRHPSDKMVKQMDPFGRTIYWYGLIGAELDASEGTDFHAIANGFVSVTPLSVDMTAHDSLDDLCSWLDK